MAILFGVIGFYLVNSKKEILQGPSFTDVVLDEGLKLKNIHYAHDNPDDKVKWVLDAKEVKFSQDREHISFKDFRLKLEPENKPSIELEGKRGEYDKSAGKISLQGNLLGYTDNDYKIMTDHILYNQKEGFLKTDEPVKIIGPFFSVSGNGLYFNLEREFLKILSGVTTLIDRKHPSGA